MDNSEYSEEDSKFSEDSEENSSEVSHSFSGSAKYLEFPLRSLTLLIRLQIE